MKNVVSRFAPSPTGRLHLGHAYSALLAQDFARSRDGALLLRIEDIDPGRARSAYVDAIIEDLLWLGIEFDEEIVYQSERLPLYAAALDRLKRRRLVYPCFCTRAAVAAEIAASAAAPHTGPGSGAGGPDRPVYPGTCRALSEDEAEERRQSEPHAWRLDMVAALDLFPSEGRGPATASDFIPGHGEAALTWWDNGREIPAEPLLFGDVVLARKDAPTSYHLAVTVDDADQGITDVVRGRDLFAATHIHRLLQALLGLPTPHYHHHALLTDAAGRRLAKRHGAPTLGDLRAAGADPARLAEDLLAGRLPAGYSAAEP
ncbi:MAG TPA: tRNA glutamyl-Q(34) synthetase GluQRS [Allosphingosinicella sp.]|nr:tRNA glutamyl-Q(34) synthetase GluQRS [Allosphingosinicella sp.]